MARNYEQTSPTQYQRHPKLTRDEVWIRAFLHAAPIGHLGHSRDDQPFITPTIFWYDEANQRLIFHSNLIGRLRDNLSHNPQACLEASEYGRFLPANTALEFSLQYCSVMVFGSVEILATEECRQALNGLLKKYFPRLNPGQEYRPITDKELAQTTVYALKIETWSGKENWPTQADQLPDWPMLPDEILQNGELQK